MWNDEETPADASTLIYLAKADAFSEAFRCVPGLLVPPAVWEEAVTAGERIGAPDVERIREAESAGHVRRVKLTKAARERARRIMADHRLGRGEAEVLALGVEKGQVVVDEGRAARVAVALGLDVASTLFLPVLGHRKRSLSRGAARRMIRELAVVTGVRAEAVFEIEKHLGGGRR